MTDTAPRIEDRLLPLGKRSLHIHRGGTKTALPTIVLEAGAGCILQTWAPLEEALAPHATLLSYERAGVGTSSGPVDSIGAEAVAQRLTTLLAATETKTPVLLVGHSVGGLYSRYFAATRPELVAGLVILDATPEDHPFPRFYSVKPTVLMWLIYAAARIGLLKRTKLSPAHLAAMARFRHIKSVLGEIAGLRQVQSEVAATKLPKNLPVLALSAALPTLEPQHQRDHFHASHELIASTGSAPHSRHQRIEGATHMSMLTDEQHAKTVAELILEFAKRIAV